MNSQSNIPRINRPTGAIVMLLSVLTLIISMTGSAWANDDGTSHCDQALHNSILHSQTQLLLQDSTTTSPLVHLQPVADQAKQDSDVAKPIKKGTFLVATKNLASSSFSETVILLTHYSHEGATGLAINRPAKMSLNEAFPGMDQLQGNHEELYLGGPVKPDTIFVLMKTKHPNANMRNIANDLYFAPGVMAFTKDKLASAADDNARAYAGYSGWAPGQLEAEVRRGDWLVIESELDIVFADENQNLWQKLTRDWSGTWI